MGKVVTAVAGIAVGIAIAVAAPYLAGALLGALHVSSAVATAVLTGIIATGLAAGNGPAIINMTVITPKPKGPIWRMAMPAVKSPSHWLRYRPFMLRGDCLGELAPDSSYILADRQAEIRAGDLVVMQGRGVCGTKVFKRAATGRIQVAATNPPETLDIDLFKLEFAYRVRAVRNSKLAVALIAGNLATRSYFEFLASLYGRFVAWLDAGDGCYEFAVWPHRQFLRALEWVRDCFPAYDERLGAIDGGKLRPVEALG